MPSGGFRGLEATLSRPITLPRHLPVAASLEGGPEGSS